MKDEGGVRPVLWCGHCGEPVRRGGAGPRGLAVHAETGSEKCTDGEHTAVASAIDPALKAEAAVIAAELGGRWEIHADLGGLYAKPAGAVSFAAVDARDGAELRDRLKMRESIDRWAARNAAREAGQS